MLLYDGVCGLCNRTVQFLLRRERDLVRRDALRFVPQQSPLGRALLAQYGIEASEAPAEEGVVLLINALAADSRIFRRTDAFIRVLGLLCAPWPLVGRLLGWTPRWLREPAYTLVARYRYRIFGRYDTCPLPEPGQQDRIIG